MTTSHPTILIVEDDNFISTYLTDKLNPQFTTRLATDTQAAGAILSEQTVHLILLDILLPGENGLSFLRSLKSSHSPHRHIPVFILSNLGQPEDIKEAFAHGAEEYLVKSDFLPEEIAKKIALRLNLPPAAD
jgi:DNA-binding response OmpR family regulator